MAEPVYDIREDLGKVRLLINDVAAPWVFQDDEVQAFLDLEGGNIKRAAAQAIDTNADNELLATKVLRTKDVDADGAKLADALHKRAQLLRDQADRDDESGDAFYVDVIDLDPAPEHVELTQYPVY